MSNKYCVYIHKRKTDGKIFYVGKGSLKRSRSSSGRSSYWHNVVNKYGFVSSIVQSNIKESEAFELEIFLISEIGRSNLCNLTDGGEGCSGRKMSDHNREKLINFNKGKRPSNKAIKASIEKHSIKVGTTCGLSFNSLKEAKNYLISIGFKKASVSSISSCIRGLTNKAYGFEWRKIINGKLSDSIYKKCKNSKMIATSCGLKFESISHAIKFLGKPNTNGYKSPIYNCINGRCNTAYGYKWGYIENGIFVKKEYKLTGHGVPIKTSCGLFFVSSVEAMRFLRKNGFKSASQGNISNALTGRVKSAYGYKWIYAK